MPSKAELVNSTCALATAKAEAERISLLNCMLFVVTVEYLLECVDVLTVIGLEGAQRVRIKLHRLGG